jgi:1,2-diacylglycerol 3-beta-glucosyltransferase
MIQTVVGVTQAAAMLMSITFLCYVAAIVLPFLRQRPDLPGRADALGWHLLIPCRDEQAVIADTIQVIRDRLPQAHVWVIDDHSYDQTASIVAAIAGHDPLVHLVRRTLPQARTGKGEALNAGYQALNRSFPQDLDRTQIIVGVLDADGQPAPDCLAVCAGPRLFGDPQVSAVQVGVWMSNRDLRRPFARRGRLVNRAGRVLVRIQDIEFRTAITALQLTRRRTQTVGLGGNGQFTRLSALDAIQAGDERPWRGLLLEDYELSVHLLLAGHRTEFTADTHVEQEGLPNLRRLLTQRTRWGQGTMQCLRYLPALWRSPHLTTVGAVEAGYFLVQPWLQLLGTFVYPIPLVLFGYACAHDPAAMWSYATSIAGWPLLATYAILGVAPFAVWGPIYRRRCEPSRARRAALGDGLAFTVFILTYYATSWRALIRILRRHHGWSKTRRNTEPRRSRIAIEA